MIVELTDIVNLSDDVSICIKKLSINKSMSSIMMFNRLKRVYVRANMSLYKYVTSVLPGRNAGQLCLWAPKWALLHGALRLVQLVDIICGNGFPLR